MKAISLKLEIHHWMFLKKPAMGLLMDLGPLMMKA